MGPGPARSGDRFTLGPGAGENLNEHVTAGARPPVNVRQEMLAEAMETSAASIPCGDDVSAVVEAVRPFVDASFTDVALVQIGGDHQESFFEAAEKEVLPALAEAFPEYP